MIHDVEELSKCELKEQKFRLNTAGITNRSLALPPRYTQVGAIAEGHGLNLFQAIFKTRNWLSPIQVV
jgi:hypothetical protein